MMTINIDDHVELDIIKAHEILLVVSAALEMQAASSQAWSLLSHPFCCSTSVFVAGGRQRRAAASIAIADF